MGICEHNSDPAGKNKVTNRHTQPKKGETYMTRKKVEEPVLEIVLGNDAIEVIPDAQKPLSINRPNKMARMKLLNTQRRDFKTALTKLMRGKREDFAYDFAVTGLALLERLTKEDGEEKVLANSVLADLVLQKYTQFSEKYAPFKAACEFVKALSESDREVDIRHYLAAA